MSTKRGVDSTFATPAASNGQEAVEHREKGFWVIEKEHRWWSMVGFFVLPFSPFFLCIWCMVVMGEKEPDLMPETMASPFNKEDVHQLKKKFNFMMDI